MYKVIHYSSSSFMIFLYLNKDCYLNNDVIDCKKKSFSKKDAAKSSVHLHSHKPKRISVPSSVGLHSMFFLAKGFFCKSLL